MKWWERALDGEYVGEKKRKRKNDRKGKRESFDLWLWSFSLKFRQGEVRGGVSGKRGLVFECQCFSSNAMCLWCSL